MSNPTRALFPAASQQAATRLPLSQPRKSVKSPRWEKRKAETNKQRSGERVSAFIARQESSRASFTATTSVLNRAKGMRRYAGPLVGGDTVCKKLPVSIFDIRGYKTVHRAADSKSSHINDACMAITNLVRKTTPTFGIDQDRGAFKTTYVKPNRGSSKLPQMPAICDTPLYEEMMPYIETIRSYSDGIFAAEFPKLRSYYANTMDAIQNRHCWWKVKCYPPGASTPMERAS
ncbi:hypothetical protein FB45DRAFT_1062409 [Roridomyces roridus]|uniref:Uncharacterized protein n=1 Tax=Roridomyces roridus TaxID=1738132 RepID=A0AAD7FI12_9AGAR|nr:hypothetical protein FB45DRAFT_1062409 [Roridomyces roridus]